MLIRLYDIELKAMWESSLKNRPLLRELYKVHGESIGTDYYGFQWDRHPESNAEEWGRVFKGGTDEEKGIMLQKFPKIEGFRTTVSQSKYLQLMEENFDGDIIRLKSVNVHEFDPDDATTPSEMVQYREQVDILNKMISKTLENLKQTSELSWNAKVAVPVSTWLNNVNEICLKEDCCSDALQDHLNDGWRIMAVCPQPDQRRPDYILGRVNTKIGSELQPDGARR